MCSIPKVIILGGYLPRGCSPLLIFFLQKPPWISHHTWLSQAQFLELQKKKTMVASLASLMQSWVNGDHIYLVAVDEHRVILGAIAVEWAQAALNWGSNLLRPPELDAIRGPYSRWGVLPPNTPPPPQLLPGCSGRLQNLKIRFLHWHLKNVFVIFLPKINFWMVGG